VEEIHENEDNNRQTRGFRARVIEDGGAGGPDDEGDEHADARPEEECSAAESVDQECSRNGSPEVEDLENTIDQSLRVRVFDAHCIEHECKIVRDYGNAIPLREGADADSYEGSFAVSRGCDKRRPFCVGGLLLQFNGVLDFCHLEFDQCVAGVAAGVVLGEYVSSFLNLAVGDEPSRGLWEESEEA